MGRERGVYLVQSIFDSGITPYVLKCFRDSTYTMMLVFPATQWARTSDPRSRAVEIVFANFSLSFGKAPRVL